MTFFTLLAQKWWFFLSICLFVFEKKNSWRWFVLYLGPRGLIFLFFREAVNTSRDSYSPLRAASRLFRSSLVRRKIQRREKSRKTSGTRVSVLKRIYPSVSYVRVFTVFNRPFLSHLVPLCRNESSRLQVHFYANPTHFKGKILHGDSFWNRGTW